MMDLHPRIGPQSIQQHLHYHALPVMRRRHMGKHQNLPLFHGPHQSRQMPTMPKIYHHPSPRRKRATRKRIHRITRYKLLVSAALPPRPPRSPESHLTVG